MASETKTVHIPKSKPPLYGGLLVGSGPAPGPEKTVAERRQRTILLVDDDPEMRNISRRVVEAAGYRFIEASGGRQGLEMVLREHPDMLLLDYMMPDLSGLEVFEELIANPVYREVSEIPVIMITAKPEYQVDRNRLFEMGLSAFLVKPFGGRELINVIDNVFILHSVQQRNKELQQEIRRTEYKYQDLIENASDLIFTLDRDGNFRFINRRMLALTGYNRDDWIGRSFYDLVDEADREAAKANFRDTLMGKARIFEVGIRSADQRTLYFSTNINPLFERGRVVGCVAIARDITRRKKLEQEVTELKNFTESIVQSMGAGLITLDLDRRITYFNNAAEAVLGYEAAEVLGKHLDEVFSSEESAYLLPDPEDPKEPLYGCEAELTTRDGRRVHVGYTITPRIDNHGERVGTIISFRDISDIKQMQAEVARMDRLASLGVLASGIAHEIRNPLAGIKTMAQTLEEEIDPIDPRREYLTRIVRQVNRMDELLKAFFSYARPRQPVRKPHRLQEIVHEVMALLEKRLRNSNVQFQEEYDSDLPPIFVDFHQIQQVVFNLFLNALDAMPEGGQLRVEARPVTTKLQRVDRYGRRYAWKKDSSRYVEVRISDSGVGIDPKNLEPIFDPFFTTKPQGSGLGLSIVYRIIEEHKGEIRVESERGKGSTFILLLPAEE
jgi:PAS domain S-box-containing protein